MHVIAAKAVCFREAAKASFKVYQQQVINNSSAFAHALKDKGFHLVSGGSDNHLMLLDLRPSHPDLTGKQGQIALDGAMLHLTEILFRERHGVHFKQVALELEHPL